jgi:ABC-type multidrug transport system ATPase subunit
MNIICNIIPKDEGEIIFDEGKVKIGYLPETPALYGYMNGYEYLDFIGACCEYEGDISARTREVLEVVGMLDGGRRRIKGYSRGMNQRVGIAAALYGKPDLIILDEPTSALDPEGRAEVMEIIRRLANSGSTIILCTHILSDVERVANKVAIMKNGVMAVEGGLKEVKEKFEGRNAIKIRLREYTAETVSAVCSTELTARSEVNNISGITLHPMEGVTDREFFNKVISSLDGKNILPEAVEFKRMTLEEIYIGINSGRLNPADAAAQGGA